MFRQPKNSCFMAVGVLTLAVLNAGMSRGQERDRLNNDGQVCIGAQLRMPTRYSADYTIKLPHGSPKAVRLEMTAFHPRVLDVPHAVEVAVPAKQ